MPTWHDAMAKAMKKALVVINNHQRDLAFVATGAMRRSIGREEPQVSGDVVTGVTFAGGAGAPYAKAVEFGTGIHSEAPDSKHQLIVIVPVKAKALAWARTGVGPTLPAANPFAQSVGMHLGSRGGVNLRLSGELRTAVKKGLLSGAIPARHVFNFAQRVVQEGQHPHSFMRRGLDEAADEVMEIARQAAGTVVVDTE